MKRLRKLNPKLEKRRQDRVNQIISNLLPLEDRSGDLDKDEKIANAYARGQIMAMGCTADLETEALKKVAATVNAQISDEKSKFRQTGNQNLINSLENHFDKNQHLKQALSIKGPASVVSTPDRERSLSEIQKKMPELRLNKLQKQFQKDMEDKYLLQGQEQEPELIHKPSTGLNLGAALMHSALNQDDADG